MSIETDEKGRPLSLPGFDLDEVCMVRLSSADLARLFKVSRARVSQWVRTGKISRYADGKIDPSRAAAELVKNCNINRLQAQPFKPLSKEVSVVRGQLRDLIAERDALAGRVELLRGGLTLLLRRFLETDFWLAQFFARLESEPGGDLQAAFDAAGVAAMRADLDELARMMDPDLRAAVEALDAGLLPASPATDGRPAPPCCIAADTPPLPDPAAAGPSIGARPEGR